VASRAFVAALAGERDWDLLETPLIGTAIADALDAALSARGGRLERTESPGRAFVDLPRFGSAAFTDLVAARSGRSVPGAAFAPASLDVPHALDELQRLLRKEWAAREEASPAADRQAADFLAEIVPQLHARGLARVGLLALAGHGAIAADLVVVDQDRAVQLLRGTDPEHASSGASEQLTNESLKLAAELGAHRFELADEDPAGRLPCSRFLRVRMWNATAVGRLHRGVESLIGRRPLAKRSRTSERPEQERRSALSTLDRLREATPEAVQRVVARVATYSTLHLYRGELFTRDLPPSEELALSLFSPEVFEALSPSEREALVDRLDLQEGYCRQKWARGDTVVIAHLDGRPAGILWCARVAVYVPDIAREVRPGVGECYIHDVYVNPEERGRKVAPQMLEFLARHLRARDVYRAWALIERTNTSSTRAFEKAAYGAVADVIYAKVGIASRVLVRPPDPEARQFLGL
jgi:GNAT superfamily N-acetyltransferase